MAYFSFGLNIKRKWSLNLRSVQGAKLRIIVLSECSCISKLVEDFVQAAFKKKSLVSLRRR